MDLKFRRGEFKMNTSIKTRSPNHSAISSWSGYNYQGKIALYCVFDIINLSIRSDLSRYALELEWYEDFAIKDGNGVYLSIHQVKSYKDKSPSRYRDAIWNLLGKVIDKGIPNGYLHTSEEIMSTNKLYKYLIDYPPSGDSEVDYTPSYYYHQVVKSNNYERAFQCFSKYNYKDGKYYCTLDEIDQLLKDQIQYYYSLQGMKVTDSQIQGVFLNLLECLNEHITSRHVYEQKNKLTEPIVVFFSDLYGILKTNWEESSEEYLVKQLKHAFYNYSESFLYDLYKQDTMDPEDLKRVNNFVATTNLLQSQRFLRFCKHITPNVSVSKLNLQKFHELVPKEGLKEALLAILMEVKQQLSSSSYLLVRKGNVSDEFYLPTTISSNPISNYLGEECSVGNVAIDILNNEEIDEFLFEVDAIITRFISTNSLEESASKVNDVPSVDPLYDNDRHERITKIKNVKMVDLIQAKEDLNNERNTK